jgi:hypothetical protein
MTVSFISRCEREQYSLKPYVDHTLSFYIGSDICTRERSRVARWYIFKPKNADLGKFWRALEWKSLAYSLAILNILLPFSKFYGHLVI